MDRLLLMHSFVTVAQASGFSGAAKKLGSSGSLVSRHVAELERQVGVRLVNRTARSVSLTEPGQRYAEFAARILEEIEAEDSRHRPSPRPRRRDAQHHLSQMDRQPRPRGRHRRVFRRASENPGPIRTRRDVRPDL